MRLVYGNSFKNDCEKYDNIIDFTSYSLNKASSDSDLLDITPKNIRKEVKLFYDDLTKSLKINLDFEDGELNDCYNSIYIYYKIISEDIEKLAFVLAGDIVDGTLNDIPLCHTKNLITVNLSSLPLNCKFNCKNIEDDTKFLEGYGNEVGNNVFEINTYNDESKTVSVNTYRKLVRETNLEKPQYSAAIWFDKEGELRSDCFNYRHYKELYYQLADCTNEATDEEGNKILSRNSLSNVGGEIRVFGYAIYDEYSVMNGSVTKIVSDGKEPIQNISGIYLECIKTENGFKYSLDNRNQIINYGKSEKGSEINSPSGIFRLCLETFIDKDKTISTIYSDKFKLIQGKYDGNWFVKDEDIKTGWRENNTPVYIFESRKSDIETKNNIFSFYVYSDAEVSALDKNEIRIVHGDSVISSWFEVIIDEPESTNDGGSKVHVTIAAKQDNTSVTNFAPINDNGDSVIAKTSIYYKCNKIDFYMVQKSSALGELKLTNTSDDITKNDNVFTYSRDQKTATFIFEPGENEKEEYKKFNYWKVVENPNTDVIFSESVGKVTESSDEQFTFEISYTSESESTLPISSEFINIIRIQEKDKDIDIENLSWRDVALNKDFIVYQFKVDKLGEEPFIEIIEDNIEVQELGKYSVHVRSNCPFYLDFAAGYNSNVKVQNFFLDLNDTISDLRFFRYSADRRDASNNIRRYSADSTSLDYLFCPFFGAQGYFEDNYFNQNIRSTYETSTTREPSFDNRVYIKDFDKENGVEVFFLRKTSSLGTEEAKKMGRYSDKAIADIEEKLKKDSFDVKLFAYSELDYTKYDYVTATCKTPQGPDMEGPRRLFKKDDFDIGYSTGVYFQLSDNKDNFEGDKYYSETKLFSGDSNTTGDVYNQKEAVSDRLDYLVFLNADNQRYVKFFYNCSALNQEPFIEDTVTNLSNTSDTYLTFHKPLSPEFDEDGNYLYHTMIVSYRGNNIINDATNDRYFTIYFPGASNYYSRLESSGVKKRYHIFGGNIKPLIINGFNSKINTGENIVICNSPVSGQPGLGYGLENPIVVESNTEFDYSYGPVECLFNDQKICYGGYGSDQGNFVHNFSYNGKQGKWSVIYRGEDYKRHISVDYQYDVYTEEQDKTIVSIPLRFVNTWEEPGYNYIGTGQLIYVSNVYERNRLTTRFKNILNKYGNLRNKLDITFKIVWSGNGTHKVTADREYVDFRGGEFKAEATFPANQQDSVIDAIDLVNISKYNITGNIAEFTVPDRLNLYSYNINNPEYLSYAGNSPASARIKFTPPSHKPMEVEVNQVGFESGLVFEDKVYFLDGGGGISNKISEENVSPSTTSLSFTCGKATLGTECIKLGDDTLEKPEIYQTSGDTNCTIKFLDTNKDNLVFEFPANNTTEDITREFNISCEDGDYKHEITLTIVQKGKSDIVELLDSVSDNNRLLFLSTGDYYSNIDKIGRMKIKSSLPEDQIKLVTYKHRGIDRTECLVKDCNPISRNVGGFYEHEFDLNVGQNNSGNIIYAYAEFYNNNTNDPLLKLSGGIGYYTPRLKIIPGNIWYYSGESLPSINSNPEKQTDTVDWDERIKYQLSLVRRECEIKNDRLNWGDEVEYLSYGMEDNEINKLISIYHSFDPSYFSDKNVGLVTKDSITAEKPELKELFPVLYVTYEVFPSKVSEEFEIKIKTEPHFKYVKEFEFQNNAEKLNEYISTKYSGKTFKSLFMLRLNKLSGN